MSVQRTACVSSQNRAKHTPVGVLLYIIANLPSAAASSAPWSTVHYWAFDPALFFQALPVRRWLE